MNKIQTKNILYIPFLSWVTVVTQDNSIFLEYGMKLGEYEQDILKEQVENKWKLHKNGKEILL